VISDLLRAPETRCPSCKGDGVTWEGGSPLGRGKLAFARMLSAAMCRMVPLRLRCKACKLAFDHLHVLPRTVVGFHGCHRDFARELVAGKVSTEAWKMSENFYDWLGKGIYFWEHAPGRAWQWAREHYGDAGAVVAVEIRLGRCLDLADTAFTSLLQRSYDSMVRMYGERGWPLPKNTGKEFKLRKLDRVVINQLTNEADGIEGFTIRRSAAHSRKVTRLLKVA
jgi:hypothetical protein